MTLALGVLCSGRGSNLGALLDAIGDGRLDARVQVVISNRPAVPALERARQAGVPALVIDHTAFPGRASFDGQLVAALQEHGAQTVVLAGFMRLLTPVFLDAFAGQVINVHPSLLPAFPGAHAQQDALLHGVRITGCTVHYVDAGTDTGPIIAQAAVPVLEGDQVEGLSARILVEEHRLLPAALQRLALGQVRLEGRRVTVTGGPL